MAPTFSYSKVTSEDFAKRIRHSGGTFKGELRWTTNLKLHEWKTNLMRVTAAGTLTHTVNKNGLSVSDDTKLSGAGFSNSLGEDPSSDSRHAVIRHLSGCRLRLLADPNGKQRHCCGTIIKVVEHADDSKPIYLTTATDESLFDFFCALTWWSALKPNGIFNKTMLLPNYQEESAAIDGDKPLLSGEVMLFGPAPGHIEAIATENAPAVPTMFVPEESSDSWRWYPVHIKLFPDGHLRVADTNSEFPLFNVDITHLLRSEIRLLDFSLFQDNCSLFLGKISKLRSEVGLYSNTDIITNVFDGGETPQLILNFPNKSPLDDWFVALKSFAIAELLGLNGSDKSNQLRVSNKFTLSILEADFDTLDLEVEGEDTYLYAEIWMWDKMWAKTPGIKNSSVPFWREEFSFDEEIRVSELTIKLVQEISHDHHHNHEHHHHPINPHTHAPEVTSVVLGEHTISHDIMTSSRYKKETRAPIYSKDHANFQVASLCFKVNSTVQFVLPSVNFTKFNTVVANTPLQEISDVFYTKLGSLTKTKKLDELSRIALEFFESMGKEELWFQTLMEKELSDIDGAILRNSNNNHSSDHIFGTLFRGNSLLTKSTELYFFQLGRNYIDCSIAPILRDIITSGISAEIDPARIKCDENEKQSIVDANYKVLVSWAEKLWSIIYQSSNDLPVEIKTHLKNFRRELEKFCLKDNEEATLNCISGFLFLRFFCPVILNPKLFNITFDHLDEVARRNVTLVCKLLLNLSTLKSFGDKEPFMRRANSFIEAKTAELKDYIDKVTDKKLDFNTKILNLEDGKTSSLLASGVTFNLDQRRELPLTPFLIDSCLRETEFVQLLNVVHMADSKGDGAITSLDFNKLHKRTVNRRSHGVDIGELEFEKLTENNAEIFGDDFMQFLEVEDENGGGAAGKADIASLAISTETAATGTNSSSGPAHSPLMQEASLIALRLERIVKLMSDYEQPTSQMCESKEYAMRLAHSVYFSPLRKIVVDTSGALLYPVASTPEFTPLFAGQKTDGAAEVCSPGLFGNTAANGTHRRERSADTASDDESDGESGEDAEVNGDSNNFYMGSASSPSTRTLSKFASLIIGGGSSSTANSSNADMKDGDDSGEPAANARSPSKLSRWFKIK